MSFRMLGAIAVGFFGLAWTVDALLGIRGLVALMLSVFLAPFILTATLRVRSAFVVGDG